VQNSKQIYKEDFHFARHCEEPLKIIIGFVRSQGDVPVRLRLSNPGLTPGPSPNGEGGSAQR